MKQLTKLRICDWSLIPLSLLILLSGIQLEVLHGGSPGWTIVHIVLGSIFMAVCGWHVWLHFKRSNWFARFRKQKSVVTKILWWIAIITLLTGLIATVHRIAAAGHVPIGGVHGKIGFLMIIIVACHAIKRKKFYLR